MLRDLLRTVHSVVIDGEEIQLLLYRDRTRGYRQGRMVIMMDARKNIYWLHILSFRLTLELYRVVIIKLSSFLLLIISSYVLFPGPL